MENFLQAKLHFGTAAIYGESTDSDNMDWNHGLLGLQACLQSTLPKESNHCFILVVDTGLRQIWHACKPQQHVIGIVWLALYTLRCFPLHPIWSMEFQSSYSRSNYNAVTGALVITQCDASGKKLLLLGNSRTDIRLQHYWLIAMISHSACFTTNPCL